MSQTKAQLIDPVDGTIVNADINASAAIAGSKISPDFGSQNILTTGSVGIGIGSQTPSTPQKQLHIAHDSSPRIMLSNDTTGHATPNGTELLLDSGGNFEILQRENLNVEFFTNNSQRMTINGSGNVGIGTTSPAQKLHIESSGDTIVRVTSADGNAAFIDLGDASDPDGGRIHYDSGSNLVFNTASAERMRINSSGNVGIGTTNPSSKIDIHCGTDNTGLQITSTDAGAFASYFDNTGASTIGHSGTDLVLSCDPAGSVGSSNIVFQVDSNNERMRINSSGDLCVGTTSAIGKSQIATSASEIGLTVSNDTHDSSLQILATAANKNSNIFFGDNDDGNVGRIDYDHNNNSLAFFVSGAERARFDSSGDFSIGSSTINLQSSNRTVLNVNGQTSTALCFNSNDTITGFMFADSGEFRIQAEAGASNLVKIRNNNGTICHFDDDGIKFNGDTAAANGLDDYEEGTFTPTASAVTLTGTIAGHYTKIGDLCYVSAIFQIPSTSNTSDIEINGLPFNAKNGTDGNFIQGGYTIYHNQGSSYNVLLQNNMNRLVLYKLDGQRQTFDAFSGKTLRMAAVYKVA